MKFAMSGLCCKRPSETPPIIDVEKVIQDYVWRKVKGDRYPLARICMRRCDYDIEVPSNYFHFEDIDEEIIEDKKPSPKQTSKPKREEEKTTPHLSVLCTEFRNNTETEQTFQFRFQKTRNASVNVTFQKGFTIGGKAHFTLKFPKYLAEGSGGGEVNFKYQVTKTTGESFDESVTIEVMSDIRVFKQRKYTAKVALAERQFSGKFRVETLMEMPLGSAPIFVRRKRNRELYCTESISDLKSVFADLPVEFVDVSKSEKVARYAVKFVTTGIIEGYTLLGQNIYIDSEALDECDNFTVMMPTSLEDVVNTYGKNKTSDMKESRVDSATKESGQETLSTQRETKILAGPGISRITATAEHEDRHKIAIKDVKLTSKFKEGLGSGNGTKERMTFKTDIQQTAQRESDIKQTSQTESGIKQTSQIGSGIKETSQTESGIKQTSQIRSGIKETSQTESKVKQTSQTESKVKETSQTESDIKRTSHTESRIKQKTAKSLDTEWTSGSESNIKGIVKLGSNIKKTEHYESEVTELTRTTCISDQRTHTDVNKLTTDTEDTLQTERIEAGTSQTRILVDKRIQSSEIKVQPLKPAPRRVNSDLVERHDVNVAERRDVIAVERRDVVVEKRDINAVERCDVVVEKRDVNVAVKRAKAKKDLKGDVFTRHSLPVAQNDELRKAILSEEKRRSLSKLTKCTSV